MSTAISDTRPSDPMPLPEDAELAPLVEQALACARQCGADGAEAGLSVGNGLSVRVRMGEVDTLQQKRDHGFSITAHFGQSVGSAGCNQLQPDAIRAAVEAACAIARSTAPDSCNGLAEPELLARDPVDLNLYHPWAVNPEGAIDLARACEAAGLAHHASIGNSEGATLSTRSSVRCYGNSNGFLATTRGSYHSLVCVMVAADDNGMQRDYWTTVSRDPARLESGESVGAEAGRRAVARLGAAPIDTRTVPVVFAAPIARGLIGSLLGAISGGSLYRKASFLLDQLNQTVCAKHLDILERPHIPGGLGSAAFDGEGVATHDRDLVQAGVLRGYLLGSYSARKLGMRSTGNAGGAHNILVQSQRTLDLPALLARMGNGLLVTELMGQGVNMVTGDYSRGAAGFWVQNGEIGAPVEGVTIAGNLKTMFTQIDAVGDDVDARSNILTGSILIEQMTVAGA